MVWSRLAHPLGNTKKVPYRRRCLTGDPFIHCNLAKWEQSRGVLQLSGALQRGCATGALPLYVLDRICESIIKIDYCSNSGYFCQDLYWDEQFF